MDAKWSEYSNKLEGIYEIGMIYAAVRVHAITAQKIEKKKNKTTLQGGGGGLLLSTLNEFRHSGCIRLKKRTDIFRSASLKSAD